MIAPVPVHCFSITFIVNAIFETYSMPKEYLCQFRKGNQREDNTIPFVAKPNGNPSIKRRFQFIIIIIIIISIFKEDNVFSIIASLPYGPPVNTDIDYYQTFFSFFSSSKFQKGLMGSKLLFYYYAKFQFYPTYGF